MRADRLLSVLMLLQVNRRMPARALAQRLEVSERTILRDMEALSASGIPVYAERGVAGGWSLLDDYQSKLTGLTTDEVRSLFLARPLSLMADLGLKRSADAALTKLQASLPESSRSQAELSRQRILIDSKGWRDPAESLALLPILLDTLSTGCRLRFLYRHLLCEPEERSGDPLGLVAKGSIWYLVALVGGEPRTYRVSRISDVIVLDQQASPLPQFDLADYWEKSAAQFREQLPRYYATFRAESSAMRWIRYRGWRLEEWSDGDPVLVRIRFDIEEEAIQFGLSLGASIEVVEPTELKTKVLQNARAIIARYENQTEV